MKVSITVGQQLAGRPTTLAITSVPRSKVGKSHDMMKELPSLSRHLFSMDYLQEVITMHLK
jgi:hypothetical protein